MSPLGDFASRAVAMEIDCGMLEGAGLDRMMSEGPFCSDILPGIRRDIFVELKHILHF